MESKDRNIKKLKCNNKRKRKEVENEKSETVIRNKDRKKIHKHIQTEGDNFRICKTRHKQRKEN